MSPFDLRGPDFLFFYLVLGAIVLVAVAFWRRLIDPRDAIKADVSDPYLVACLRGGKNELLRVATVSLIHRRLLQVKATKISVTPDNAAVGIRNPLERELLSYFKNWEEASSVFSEARFLFRAKDYEHILENLGLLPNAQVRSSRARILAAALFILWGVALIKIVVALARGHSNIGFLIILAVAFGWGAGRLARPRLTPRGKSMVEDLRLLFSGLRSRSSATLTANDVALLAAVFGVGSLPLLVFPYARTLYPKALDAEGKSGAGLSSSSCGASTSCGSSGGDGGGGCGGGGGGCGGCGS